MPSELRVRVIVVLALGDAFQTPVRSPAGALAGGRSRRAAYCRRGRTARAGLAGSAFAGAAPRRRSRDLGRRGPLAGGHPLEADDQRVVGHELGQLGVLAGRGLVRTLGRVEVGQDEPGRRVGGVLRPELLERPELLGIDVDVRVERDQGRPVPAGAGGEDGVEGRRRVLVLAHGEEGHAAELVGIRVIGQGLDRLVDQVERLGIVAGLEGVARLVERGDGRGDHLVGRGRGGRVEGHGVVVGRRHDAAREGGIGDPRIARPGERVC